MNYTDERLLDALAREYVLGTLDGQARARFERILKDSLPARRAVLNWERRLAPLGEATTPITPPAGTWSEIERALDFPMQGRAPPSSRGWQAAAAVFAVAAVILGTLFYAQSPDVREASYLAIVSDEQETPLWLVQIFAEPGELQVDAVNDRPAPIGNSYELWTLPDDGSAPISLGVILGTGETRLALTEDVLQILGQSSLLAVSLEPEGGSPTGAPTGPVLFTADVVQS